LAISCTEGEQREDVILKNRTARHEVVKTAVDLGILMMATCVSPAYFDAYRSERLPSNLIQAQRDYFGAHTYQRVDREGAFHSKWK